MTMKDRFAGVARARWAQLIEPVDIASIVFFRVSFGLLLAVEIGRYFAFGWIQRFYIDPRFYFTYYGFGWVRPLPGQGMYYLFAALGLGALCILIGYQYRLATTLFFLGFTYVFLLDQTRYLNHFYLISLISFLLIFVPAHRALSLDARLKSSIASRTVPRWALWILRAQFAVVYVYGGIAKINGDWLRGFPMRDLLLANASLPWVGPHLGERWVVLAFAYGGLLFDLFIVPLLLWRRTRYLALAWAVAFHVMNHAMFNIGVFPWFALAGTMLFLPPDWPRRLIPRRLRKVSSEAVAPVPSKAHMRKRPAPAYPMAAIMVVAIFLALQLLVPLRHLLYPGNVNWTDEGHRFSWRMMLRAKSAVLGRFVAHDHYTQRRVAIEPLMYLDKEQRAAMLVKPDMILQFAHFADEQLRRQGLQVVEIRSYVTASLNGRRPQLLVNPDVNLAAEQRTLRPARWIVPLTEPLPDLPALARK